MSDRPGLAPTCLNCGARLSGQYCGQCGQRAANRLISLWELLRDAFGDLFELDSRLWRTLIPLLARPGLLTADYLGGRRARYMPPFRMYLVLSLVFFVIAFFDPREDLAILYEPVEAPARKAEQPDAEPGNDSAPALVDAPGRREIVDEAVPTPDDALVTGTTAAQGGESRPADGAAADREGPGFNITFDEDEAECHVGGADLGGLPEFVQRRFTAQRLEQVCERVVAVGKQGVAAALLDNVPGALIILLPMMALVLKLLYPLSRRYYVEHLLFFIHFHAFLFLLLSLQILWARLAGWTASPEFIGLPPIVATSFYIPVYLYKSMRRVYGQRRWLTVLKFLALSIAYVLGLGLMMLGALLIAVFSV